MKITEEKEIEFELDFLFSNFKVEIAKQAAVGW